MSDDAIRSNIFVPVYEKALGWIIVVCLSLFGARSFIAYNRAHKIHRKPPGPVLQFINKILHREPFSFIFHGIFWSCVLIILCPLAGILVVVYSLFRCTRLLFWTKQSVINPENNDKELAVYITGCDSGFGKDLTFALSEKGYTVFSGCLTKDGMEQYKGMKTVIPIEVDVTKNEDALEAASIVSDWLKAPSKKTRVIHCIVNNAGIGNAGLIDWVDLSTFRKVMDVNCFGTIRTVKSFLPLFKQQAFANTHPQARIINVVSMAGLISTTGACAYSSSKHATDAFTACLRLEMKAFKIPVVSVNPSWHQTPLSESIAELLNDVWNGLSQETQEEYGEEYFSSFSEMFLNKRKKEWSSDVVKKELVSCVEIINPPDQVIIGSDAKYAIMVMRLLPVWLQLKIFDYISPSVQVAKMK